MCVNVRFSTILLLLLCFAFIFRTTLYFPSCVLRNCVRMFLGLWLFEIRMSEMWKLARGFVLQCIIKNKCCRSFGTVFCFYRIIGASSFCFFLCVLRALWLFSCIVRLGILQTMCEALVSVGIGKLFAACELPLRNRAPNLCLSYT